MLFRSAIKDASDFYVNPQEAPLWIQKLRNSPTFSAASMFPTWAWHMMDLPGKEGVFARVLKAGSGIVESDSPTVLAQNFSKLAGVAARRAAITSLARTQSNEQQDELALLLGGRGDTSVRVTPGDQPDTLRMKSYSAYNPFALSNLMIQLGHNGLSWVGSKVMSEIGRAHV